MVRLPQLLVTLCLAACTFPEAPLPPGDSRVVVHAVLDPSRNQQVVELTATDGARIDLDSALVVVVAPDGSELRARQDSVVPTHFGPVARNYRVDLQSAGVSLQAGGTYHLRITLRSGDLISGSTTLPDASPAPVPPATQLIRARDTVRLSWASVSGARSYELQVWRSFTQFANSAWQTHAAFVTAPLTVAGTATTWDDSEIFPLNARASVLLFAVDENYYEYYRVVGDPYVGAAPSRLQGALGVFGSVVPVIHREFDVK